MTSAAPPSPASATARRAFAALPALEIDGLRPTSHVFRLRRASISAGTSSPEPEDTTTLGAAAAQQFITIHNARPSDFVGLLRQTQQRLAASSAAVENDREAAAKSISQAVDRMSGIELFYTAIALNAASFAGLRKAQSELGLPSAARLLQLAAQREPRSVLCGAAAFAAESISWESNVPAASRPLAVSRAALLRPALQRVLQGLLAKECARLTPRAAPSGPPPDPATVVLPGAELVEALFASPESLECLTRVFVLAEGDQHIQSAVAHVIKACAGPSGGGLVRPVLARRVPHVLGPDMAVCVRQNVPRNQRIVLLPFLLGKLEPVVRAAHLATLKELHAELIVLEFHAEAFPAEIVADRPEFLCQAIDSFERGMRHVLRDGRAGVPGDAVLEEMFRWFWTKIGMASRVSHEQSFERWERELRAQGFRVEEAEFVDISPTGPPDSSADEGDGRNRQTKSSLWGDSIMLLRAVSSD